MCWSVFFFHEAITAQMIVGAVIVMIGVVWFNIADARDKEAADAQAGDAA